MLLYRRENQHLKSQSRRFILCYCNTLEHNLILEDCLEGKKLYWLNPQSWNLWSFERCDFHFLTISKFHFH